MSTWRLAQGSGWDGVDLVAIGASTGGPAALQVVLGCLPGCFPVPVLVLQHMPGAFTPGFAERLDALCLLRVREARDGDVLIAGQVLVAPGGYQVTIGAGGARPRLRVRHGADSDRYRPCIDTTFASVADVFGERALAVVLTGMGADGAQGAERLKAAGATVWAQDEESCVVGGMPMAVVRAGVADRVLALDRIGPELALAG